MSPHAPGLPSWEALQVGRPNLHIRFVVVDKRTTHQWILKDTFLAPPVATAGHEALLAPSPSMFEGQPSHSAVRELSCPPEGATSALELLNAPRPS